MENTTEEQQQFINELLDIKDAEQLTYPIHTLKQTFKTEFDAKLSYVLSYKGLQQYINPNLFDLTYDANAENSVVSGNPNITALTSSNYLSKNTTTANTENTVVTGDGNTEISENSVTNEAANVENSVTNEATAISSSFDYKQLAPPTVNYRLLYLDSLFGNRNIYFHNHFRGDFALLNFIRYGNVTDKNDITKIISTPMFLSYISNNNTVDITRLYLFNYQRIYDYCNEATISYITNSSSNSNSNNANDAERSGNSSNNNNSNNVNDTERSGNSSKIIKYTVNYELQNDKYRVEKIPGNLLKLFSNIGRNVVEAKKYLKLNNETGFYCYKTASGANIPIICKHQMMYLEHKNVYDITNECYQRGVCKYCGTDLVNFNQSDNFVLSSYVISVIVAFAECFKTSTLVDDIVYETTEFLINKLEKDNISSYDDKTCYGYVCLYLIRLIAEIPKHFNVIKAKLKDLLHKLSFELAALGKNDEDVKLILQDNSIIEDVATLIDRLKSINISSINDTNARRSVIEDVFFNSSTHEAKTELQKLHITDPAKIFALHIALDNIVNSLYNYDCTAITSSKALQLMLQNNNKTSFPINVPKDGFGFFKEAFVYYCPVNYTHNYVNGRCSYCGINENGKNIIDIYEKYYSKIVNTTIAPPHVITQEMAKRYNAIRANTADVSHNAMQQLMHTDVRIDYKDILFKFINDMNQLQLIERHISEENLYVANTCRSLGINEEDYTQIIAQTNLAEFVKRLFIYSLKTIYKDNKDVGVNYFIASYYLEYNPLDFITV